MKSALITGIAGQDGSYLAEYLLTLGYAVHGLVRRDPATMRNLRDVANRVNFIYGDMRDALSLETAFLKADPDEVYNLAAQPFIPTSWISPSETHDVNVGGFLRIMKIVETIKPTTRVYQASSSEMYGNSGVHASETTAFAPASPYGVSKLASHTLCNVYRQRGLYAASGILFNHESPRRGLEMVTRKITAMAGEWAAGNLSPVTLGNLKARRDWGFAGDYVRAMHLMLQRDTPQDYVIGTGESHSIMDFVQEAIRQVHSLTGDEKFLDKNIIFKLVATDPRFVRTNEIHDLVADATKAKNELGWQSTTSFETLVRMMVLNDFRHW